MLARLQRAITLSLLLAAGLWAAWFTHAGRPWLAGLGAALIVFGYALFLAIEFVLVRFVHGDDPAPRPTAAQLFKAWCGEVQAAPRVFCWQQPFRSEAIPDTWQGTPGRRGVVLVHGFFCNRGFWNRWMPRLKAQGIPFVAVSLEPVFGSIGAYAALIEDAVQRIERSTGRPPVLVGHSMGGLAIRAWAAAFGGLPRMHSAITIGTPHRGTWLGRFGFSRNAREMSVGAAWQRALEAREAGQAAARFTCYYSHCDNIVFPASNATLAGADNRHVQGMAHVQLLDYPEIFNEVAARTAAGD